MLGAGKALSRAHRKLPVLRTIAWPSEVRQRFFQDGERELPRVSYPEFDPAPALEDIKEATRLVKSDRDDAGDWMRRSADALRNSAYMLGAMGSWDFSSYAEKLYGTPKHLFPQTNHTPLEQARRLIRTWKRVARRLPPAPEPDLTAVEAAEQIGAAVRKHFKEHAPRVEVVRNLAARASAAPSRIKLRQDAHFSDLDVRQLAQHEAFVHVATSLNGRRQRKMPLLGLNHAGTTRTQEGLAVFAELISGALDPRRFLRLAHRVVAIDMALDGGDFLQVYAYFKEHSQNHIEAYESTARIFRGGNGRGGNAFTKDMVYLDGLSRVHVFIRAVVDTGRVDVLNMLFAGKLDLQDVPALLAVRREGLCLRPKFVPPWVMDPRRLVAYFAVTDVIGHAATGGLRRHYVEQLTELPGADA